MTLTVYSMLTDFPRDVFTKKKERKEDMGQTYRCRSSARHSSRRLWFQADTAACICYLSRSEARKLRRDVGGALANFHPAAPAVGEALNMELRTRNKRLSLLKATFSARDCNCRCAGGACPARSRQHALVRNTWKQQRIDPRYRLTRSTQA
jgi:hypothetical protein